MYRVTFYNINMTVTTSVFGPNQPVRSLRSFQECLQTVESRWRSSPGQSPSERGCRTPAFQGPAWNGSPPAWISRNASWPPLRFPAFHAETLSCASRVKENSLPTRDLIQRSADFAREVVIQAELTSGTQTRSDPRDREPDSISRLCLFFAGDKDGI